MHPNLIRIGMNIKKLRLLKGFSPEELAVLAHLNPSYYRKLETGEVNILVQDLISIALGLKVEIEELIPSLDCLTNPASRQEKTAPRKKSPKLILRQNWTSYWVSTGKQLV